MTQPFRRSTKQHQCGRLHYCRRDLEETGGIVYGEELVKQVIFKEGVVQSAHVRKYRYATTFE